MKTASRKMNYALLFPLIVIGLGLTLLIYMVTVEDEPGALPLALILGGTVWFFIARRKNKLKE